MPIGGGYSIVLQREWAHQPWGLRLVGGCDLNKPLHVIRVASGSPAEKVLKAGDVILQIEQYDARDLRHQDALMLFQNAVHQIKLVILRESGPAPPQLSAKDWISEPKGIPLPQSQLDIAAPQSLNEALVEGPSTSQQGDLVNQPYRTTPLVLPGAKVRRDFNSNESYLRHHPNPSFRQAAPSPLMPHEISMKQKVADTVIQKVEQESGGGKQISHKQFNSPIGLYSDQNIVDQISGQASTTMPMLSPTCSRTWGTRPSPRKTVQYDPSKSETYKALQNQALGPDVHEVTPVEHRVFTPAKIVPPMHAKPAQPLPTPGPLVNSLGHPEEIQQSNTFKRLMYMVQSEGVY